MNNPIKKIKNEYGIDFLNDFLMISNEIIYFYIDISNNDLLNNKLNLLFGEWDLLMKCNPHDLTIKHILSNFDHKCEHVEVKGFNNFYNEIINEISSKDELHSVDIPLVYNNKPIWIGLSIKIFRDKNIALCSIKEQTQNKNQLEKLFITSYKDQLTGLFNRNTFIYHLERINVNENVYLLMIDLDNFKTVNDNLGHKSGDELLKAFGEKLLTLVNDSCIFYRLSGDEFIIQVKNYTRNEVEGLAKEINTLTRDLQYDNIYVSASIGIAKFRKLNSNIDMLHLVDTALYVAKEQRDTYNFYDEL